MAPDWLENARREKLTALDIPLMVDSTSLWHVRFLRHVFRWKGYVYDCFMRQNVSSENDCKVFQGTSSYGFFNMTKRLKKNPLFPSDDRKESALVEVKKNSSSITAQEKLATRKTFDSISNQRFCNSSSCFFFHKNDFVMPYWLPNDIYISILVLDCQIMNEEIRSSPPSFKSQFQFQW